MGAGHKKALQRELSIISVESTPKDLFDEHEGEENDGNQSQQDANGIEEHAGLICLGLGEGLGHRGGVDRLLCHGLLGRSLRHLGGDLRSHGLQDRWRAGLEDRRRRRSHLIHGGKLWFLG